MASVPACRFLCQIVLAVSLTQLYHARPPEQSGKSEPLCGKGNDIMTLGIRKKNDSQLSMLTAASLEIDKPNICAKLNTFSESNQLYGLTVRML